MTSLFLTTWHMVLLVAEMVDHAKEPWPSLDWASWLFDRASFLLITSLVLGAVATAIIVWTGIVKEKHWDLARDKAEHKITSLGPRRLSEDQKKTIYDLISSHPFAVAVVSRMMDSEGSDYAEDFASVLLKANWQARRIVNWTKSDKGVFLATVEGTQMSAEVEPLKAALTAAHIDYTITTIRGDDAHRASPWFESRVLYLMVGAKP